MDKRIEELGRKLMAITDTLPERPTQEDRNALMRIRHEIKELAEEEMNDSDTNDRQGLYALATQEANRQEAFYEQNGNEWEKATA